MKDDRVFPLEGDDYWLLQLLVQLIPGQEATTLEIIVQRGPQRHLIYEGRTDGVFHAILDGVALRRMK